jgi:broad specificity phosphatase PhoE
MKILILVRHAHRDTTDREADNGLSPKGRVQVEQLLSYWRKAFKGERAVFLSSPKRRCLETVAPLADASGSRIRVTRAMIERQEGESAAALRRRARAFIEEWRAQPGQGITVACSHGDWLPLAIEAASGARVRLSKGGWAQIELDGAKSGRPSLTWLLQHFKRLA